jgi:Gnt-I system high-affinity gluconate transporter
MVTALLPAVLLLLTAVGAAVVPPESPWGKVVKFLSDPDVVMIFSLLFAAVSLGVLRGRPLPEVMSTFSSALGDLGSILLVIAGSGVFKEVLLQSGVNKEIGTLLQGLAVNPLILGWVLTAAIRVCVGSATVAGLTAAGILAPVVGAGGVDPNLMVLAIGAGSLFASHVNDAAFWMFKEYFNVSLLETFRCWTVMETIVSVVGLAGVLVLARVI